MKQPNLLNPTNNLSTPALVSCAAAKSGNLAALKFASVSALTLALLGLVGCSSYQKLSEGQKVAYRTAEKREKSLEVPPDLTAVQPDEQFSIPGAAGQGTNAVVSAQGYAGSQRLAVVANRMATEPVLVSTDKVRIKQSGKARSLEVKLPPEQLWPALREFWKQNGFELATDDPKIGLMETQWAENRAAIPMDGIRKVLGKVFDGLYSSNTRDRYRTRLEPIDGGVEIFITHRGMEENYTDKSQTNLQWMNRPNDPELEAEMVNRLMVKLTGDQKAAQLAQTGTAVSTATVSIQRDKNGAFLLLAEDFPLAWRRLGLALDRAGFIVEDRDRANGVYYVKFTPDSAQQEEQKGGFFGKIFGKQDNKSLKPNERYQVLVASNQSGSTQARFASERGTPLQTQVLEDASQKLLSKLQ